MLCNGQEHRSSPYKRLKSFKNTPKHAINFPKTQIVYTHFEHVSELFGVL